MNKAELRTILDDSIRKLPRVKLANLPTPLDEAPRLSEALGGPRILFKRDDLTNLPLSGNKTRMFEFSLAEAVRQGADTVVQSSSVQSNYCRQLALACAKMGLKTHLVLRRVRGARDLEIQGNILLGLLAGAEIEIVDASVFDQPGLVKQKADELRQLGHVVYEARSSKRDMALDAASYVNCALELDKQLEECRIDANYLFVASTDTTQAGLLVGAKFLGIGYTIVGINPFEHDSQAIISEIANDTAEILELDLRIEPDEVINTTGFVGPGYGKVTLEALEAIKLAVRTEAVLLDPVYTGKAMAGLMSYVGEGRIGKDDTVLFVHTGGFPTTFAYRDELADTILSVPVTQVSGMQPELSSN